MMGRTRREKLDHVPVFVLVVSFVCIGSGTVNGKSCVVHHFHHSHNLTAVIRAHETRWRCLDNEFCYLHRNRTSVSSFECFPSHSFNHQECHHNQHHNPPDCHPLDNHSHSDCHYCCPDLDCLRHLTGPPFHQFMPQVTFSTRKPTMVTSTKHTTTSSTRKPTTTTSMKPTMTKSTTKKRNGCFSEPCHCHLGLQYIDSCTRGHWICSPNEDCVLHTKNEMGTMHCVSKNSHDTNRCQRIQASHLSNCTHHRNRTDCSYCCSDPVCMRTLVRSITREMMTSPVTTMASHMTSPTTTTTSPDTTTTSPTTTAKTTTTSSTTSSAMMTSGRVSVPVPGSNSCFTSTCPHNDVHDIEHCLHGEWACRHHQFCEVKMGHSNHVHMKCLDNVHKPQTCGLSNETMLSCMQAGSAPYHCRFCCSDRECVHDVLASPPTTTSAAVTFSSSPPPASAAITISSASSPVPASTVTTMKVTSTASVATPGQCVQCGDYDSGVACSNLDLFLDTVSACNDPSANLCMTDIDVDDNGVMSIYKRCVNTPTCLDQWYLQTSDKRICQVFDPVAATPDITCHYCCVGDGCNTNNLPDSSTLWRP